MFIPVSYTQLGRNITDNPDQMGQAVLAGHLLECAGQVTGGYFADPGYKDVPELWKLGFPLIEICLLYTSFVFAARMIHLAEQQLQELIVKAGQKFPCGCSGAF